MKPAFFHIITAFAILISTFSCQKNKEDDEPNPNVSNLTLLKNDQWKVAAKQVIRKNQGAQGGGMSTTTFNTQKPGELRWYTVFSTNSNYSGYTEIILNTQGNTTINSDLKAQAYGGDIKTYFGSDVWKVNLATDRPDHIYVYKNDQLIDLSKNPEGQTKIVQIQAAEDGFLNINGKSTSNRVTHYHYATEGWKDNTFSGNNFVSLRHKGKTYVIAFTRFTSEDGIKIMVESDDKIVVPDRDIPNIYTVHYPMKTLAFMPQATSGSVLHMANYNDDVFVVMQAYQSAWRYAVYKINLTNLSAELIQSPDPKVPFGLSASHILYNTTYVEVDEAGNLYVVERRVEDQKPFDAIRKYSVGGGNELILKEEDLERFTQIHSLKYFNEKLYVAIVNKETVPDNDPDDNAFIYNYHMQIICPK